MGWQCYFYTLVFARPLGTFDLIHKKAVCVLYIYTLLLSRLSLLGLSIIICIHINTCIQARLSQPLLGVYSSYGSYVVSLTRSESVRWRHSHLAPFCAWVVCADVVARPVTSGANRSNVRAIIIWRHFVLELCVLTLLRDLLRQKISFLCASERILRTYAHNFGIFSA
jgi:hypothetical protein